MSRRDENEDLNRLLDLDGFLDADTLIRGFWREVEAILEKEGIE